MSQLVAVAGSTDKFLSDTSRCVRMLSVLLTACDPCGYVEAGGSADDYTALAWQVEAALQAGMGAAQIKALLKNITETDDPSRFCEAAVDWWAHSGEARAAAA